MTLLAALLSALLSPLTVTPDPDWAVMCAQLPGASDPNGERL